MKGRDRKQVEPERVGGRGTTLVRGIRRGSVPAAAARLACPLRVRGARLGACDLSLRRLVFQVVASGMVAEKAELTPAGIPPPLAPRARMRTRSGDQMRERMRRAPVSQVGTGAVVFLAQVRGR